MKYLAKENEIFLFCLNEKLFGKSKAVIHFSKTPLHEIKVAFHEIKTPLQESKAVIHFPFLKGLKIYNFNLLQSCLGMVRSLFNQTPLQVGFYAHKRSIRAFERYVQEVKPDIVYVQFVRMAAFCRNIKEKKVLDFQDALSANMLRRANISNPFLKAVLLRETKLLRLYEAKMLDFFDLTTIITDTDRQEINSDRKNGIVISANGIDNSYFQYTQTLQKEYDIMFCGNMSYAPNVDAAKYLIKSIMPLVWAKFPQVKVLLAGANPKKCVRRLASANVEVSGYVEDMKVCYVKSKVFVAALRTGSGLQNKLLEAMAIGTPVICSSLANNALSATNNEHLLIADIASDYANLIIKLLNDNELQQHLTSNAQIFVKHTYNWDTICQNLAVNLAKASFIDL
jgi:glycosyltransferase involved in cell wall biosynthesis